ncbi:hypothetical protein ONE56_04190 [Vibrio mytili]|uniref:hypothetical protein n=1 Tax=Vibrio mytili TaxID=50718 RepID=UPI003C6F1D96
MARFKWFIPLLFTLFVVGCARVEPVRNIENTPVIYDLQSYQVKLAITQAASHRGWQIEEVSPGVLLAKINVRDHYAEVKIPYSDKYYSILYVNSFNLDAAGGNIHRNYNGWVRNLNMDTQRLLAMMAGQP